MLREPAGSAATPWQRLEFTNESALKILQPVAFIDNHVQPLSVLKVLAIAHGNLVGCHNDLMAAAAAAAARDSTVAAV